jgi:hypothetical protein
MGDLTTQKIHTIFVQTKDLKRIFTRVRWCLSVIFKSEFEFGKVQHHHTSPETLSQILQTGHFFQALTSYSRKEVDDHFQEILEEQGAGSRICPHFPWMV